MIRAHLGWYLATALILFFVFLYFFHPQGLSLRQKLTGENREQALLVEKLQHEVNTIQKSIDDWHTYPWHKEKIIREQLHLKYPEEEMYRK